MSTNLSEREMKLLTSAFQCFEAPPVVDLPKLALLEGYKSTASARTAWLNLRKKVTTVGPSAASKDSDAASETATPKKRKVSSEDSFATPKATLEVDNEPKDDVDGPGTAKKAKATPKPKGKVKKEEVVEEKVLSPEPEKTEEPSKESPTKKKAAPKSKGKKKEDLVAEPADGNDDSTIVVATRQTTTETPTKSPAKKTTAPKTKAKAKAKATKDKESNDEAGIEKTTHDEAGSDKTNGDKDTGNKEPIVNDNAPVTPNTSDIEASA